MAVCFLPSNNFSDAFDEKEFSMIKVSELESVISFDGLLSLKNYFFEQGGVTEKKPVRKFAWKVFDKKIPAALGEAAKLLAESFYPKSILSNVSGLDFYIDSQCAIYEEGFKKFSVLSEILI